MTDAEIGAMVLIAFVLGFAAGVLRTIAIHAFTDWIARRAMAAWDAQQTKIEARDGGEAGR